MGTDHLNGKRTGRPKGSKNRKVQAGVRRDILWAYANLSAFTLKGGMPEPIGGQAPAAPSAGAMSWIAFGLKHPERFLDRVANLSMTEDTKKKVSEPEPDAAQDLEPDKCVVLIENLLKDLNEKQAKEDAELAARPNAAQFAGTLQKRLAEALRREEVLKAQLARK